MLGWSLLLSQLFDYRRGRECVESCITERKSSDGRYKVGAWVRGGVCVCAERKWESCGRVGVMTIRMCLCALSCCGQAEVRGRGGATVAHLLGGFRGGRELPSCALGLPHCKSIRNWDG